MIVQNINSETQVIYTTNRVTDLPQVGEALKYNKKNGGFYKYVTVEHSTYFTPPKSTTSLPAIKLIAKGITTYVVDDTVEFNIDKSNVGNIIQLLSKFGEDYIIRYNNIDLNGPFRKNGSDSLINNESTIISIGSYGVNDNTNQIHNFIHRMRTDNGRMLDPVLRRFANTVFLFKGNKKLLTGYVNLSMYLNVIKYPSRGLFNMNLPDTKADYVINLTSNSSRVRLKVVDVINGKLVLNISLDGSIEAASQYKQQISPYVLITTAPVNLLNQKFPNFVVQYRKLPIFITPIIFNSSEILKQLRGGINLLK
jgi:hypothetical protein